MHETNSENELLETAAPEPTDPKSGPWAWTDVLLITLAIVLIFVAGMAALALLGSFFPTLTYPTAEPTLALSILLAALEVVAIVGAVWLGLRLRQLPWSAAGLRPTPDRWMQIASLLGILVVPLAGIIALVIQLVLGMELENTQIDFLAPEGFTWTGFAGMTLLGGLLAPFAEELFFRGVLFAWLRQRWGFWASALLSALIFGAVHGEISVGGAAFVLGLLLAWVYERSQSLWPAVVIHGINNSVKIVILYLLMATGNLPPGG